MRPSSLIFATLTSPLARNQTQAVIDVLQARVPRLACQLTLMTSPQNDAQRAGEHFVATSRVEIAFFFETLTKGQARLVVLEAADMLAVSMPDMAVLGVPDRAAPFDAFLNRDGRIMDEMDSGSRIGVLSMRVHAQLQALWPDLRFEILRGGVDRAMETHMRHAEIDGLVLPASVTEHLGIQGIVAEIFAPEFVLPGPGQGTLVIVGREGDDEARDLLTTLHSEDTALELAAETAFHRRMVPDQDLPVGALARVGSDGISIIGGTGTGRRRIVVSGGRHESVAVGDGLAQQILGRSDTFADLLEADFPEGIPEEADEDSALLSEIDPDESDNVGVSGCNALERDALDDLRAFEDLAGLNDKDDSEDLDDTTHDADETDPYEDER